MDTQGLITDGKDERSIKQFKTLNGKVIEVWLDKDIGFYVIRFKSGGEAPKEFEGNFTSPAEAEKFVKQYLARKQQEADSKILKDSTKAEYGQPVPFETLVEHHEAITQPEEPEVVSAKRK